jgi:hypothetical protein
MLARLRKCRGVTQQNLILNHAGIWHWGTVFDLAATYLPNPALVYCAGWNALFKDVDCVDHRWFAATGNLDAFAVYPSPRLPLHNLLN